MLTVTKPSPDRIDIELSGVLNANEMEAALDLLVSHSEGIQHGKILYTISDFEIPTLGAMATEFYKLPKLFSLIGKFDKCAVLCDTPWIRTAAQVEGAVIPYLTIKSFNLGDIKAAEDWLNSDPDDDDDDFENFPV